MSVYQTNRNVPLGAVTTFRLISSVERIIESYLKWRGARATAITLAGLSDAQLADIGVVRSEIDDLVDRLVRR